MLIIKSQGGKGCYITKRTKANWVGHILHRKCLLIHVIEEKIEGRIEVAGS
jgi:hypothetical protein